MSHQPIPPIFPPGMKLLLVIVSGVAFIIQPLAVACALGAAAILTCPVWIAVIYDKVRHRPPRHAWRIRRR